MRNYQRWFITLALGFLVGAATSATDAKATPWDVIRHGIAGMGPGAVGLRMTLSKDESAVTPPDKSFGAAA